ncbi:hypothetical protein DM02DRAFT_399975 [Periconia macrospinosa]|uniref:Uncharacterized protein n=1 Tax=Periconia macrospinosa TaxID=97972 RepID=A0A2V1CYU9_9PLEO|nr:hypothetical protein DM02DRAFT_399975 [Periconia macrospinosa]
MLGPIIMPSTAFSLLQTDNCAIIRQQTLIRPGFWRCVAAVSCPSAPARHETPVRLEGGITVVEESQRKRRLVARQWQGRYRRRSKCDALRLPRRSQAA